MAKSPKKPRRGGEHDPAVNTAAGAPSKGVSVDPAVNTAADAPSMGVSVDPAVNTAAGAPLAHIFAGRRDGERSVQSREPARGNSPAVGGGGVGGVA